MERLGNAYIEGRIKIDAQEEEAISQCEYKTNDGCELHKAMINGTT